MIVGNQHFGLHQQQQQLVDNKFPPPPFIMNNNNSSNNNNSNGLISTPPRATSSTQHNHQQQPPPHSSPSDDGHTTTPEDPGKKGGKKKSSSKKQQQQQEDDDKKKKKKMTLSKEQDLMLIDAVRQYTESNNPIQWKEINRKLFNNQYSSNFLYQRYHRTLNAKKHRWCDEEDLELLHYCTKHDKKWSLIASKEYEGYFPDIQLSNRYKNVCKRLELRKRLDSMSEYEIEALIRKNKDIRMKSLDTRNLVKVIEDNSDNQSVTTTDSSKRKSNPSPIPSHKKLKLENSDADLYDQEMEESDSSLDSTTTTNTGLHHDSSQTFIVDLDSIKLWSPQRIEEEYEKKLEFIRANHSQLLCDLLYDCESSIEGLNAKMIAILNSNDSASLKVKQVEENMEMKNGWQKLQEDCNLLRDVLSLEKASPSLDSFTFLCRAECCLASYRNNKVKQEDTTTAAVQQIL